jgi:hypothetical protein
MSSSSNNENENDSYNAYGDEDNDKTIANIEPIPKNDNNYYNNKSIEIAKTELNNKEEKNFVENFKKIIDYYYSRATILLNLKKDIKYPNLNLGDFNSHVNFLKEINRIFSEYTNSNIASDYYLNNELKNKILEVVFNNKKENINEFEFLKIIDLFFHPEKFSLNSKDKSNIINFSREILDFQNILLKLENQFNKLVSIKNYFIKYCKFKNLFDSRGDLLIPNTTNILKRGSEDYNPPYGWIGIGLNISGKYNENEDDKDGKWIFEKKDSKWANAYLGFNQENNSNNKIIIKPFAIKDYLHDLVTKNEMLEIFERKVDFDDKRHWIKKYEKGIYLNSKIENVENDSGIVTIGDKIYKLLLMVRVKIDEISQPKNKDVWVLDKKFIRVYRILLKETKNEI